MAVFGVEQEMPCRGRSDEVIVAYRMKVGSEFAVGLARTINTDHTRLNGACNWSTPLRRYEVL